MRIEESVSKILRSYLRGESTHKELRMAISFFGNPALDEEMESVLGEFWHNQQNSLPKQYESENLSEIYRQILEKIEPELKDIRRQKNRRLINNGIRIAAVLVIGIVLGFFLNTFRNTDPISYTSMAPKGSISQILLPDNTLVYLNSNSEIKYSHDGSKRKRELYLDGEAWFQVSKNKKKPFVVHTSSYDIIVTGTEFNVKAYKEDKEVTTTLESGSIIIPSKDQFRMSSAKVLEPGQQFSYNREKHTVTTSNVETRYFTSWKENKLIFINMSLEDLVVLLERKYGVDIEVNDRSIFNCHYDGTIKNESILEVMDLIKITLPIDYEVIGQTIHITKKL